MKLQELICNRDGTYSPVKLTDLVWSIVVLFVWAWCSLKSGELKAFPEVIVAVLGLRAGTVIKGALDRKEPNEPNN